MSVRRAAAFVLRTLTEQQLRERMLAAAPAPPPAQVVKLPLSGQLSFDFDRLGPGIVVTFGRPSALPDAVVEDLGRLLGEALVARYRRDNDAASR